MTAADFDQLKAFTVTIDENHVAEICLRRPEALNSMNADFWHELPEIIDALDRQGSARVIILCSSGKHFTAGMDLSVLSSMGGNPEQEPARQA